MNHYKLICLSCFMIFVLGQEFRFLKDEIHDNEDGNTFTYDREPADYINNREIDRPLDE